MGSLLFFIFFTLTALLYRIIPSHISEGLNLILIAVISLFLIITKIATKSGRRRMGGESPFANINGSDCFMFIIYISVCFGELAVYFIEVNVELIPFEKLMWTVYVITLIVNYVLPAAIYLRFRIRFYLDVREKVENHGWKMSADIREFIFSGRRNVHNITIETQSGAQTIGILGSVSAMEYVIEDGMIKAKRMLPFEKYDVTLDYGGANKKKLPFWYKIKGGGLPLPEHIGRMYLMIQPNVFVVSDDYLVDIGEEVEGMRLLDMETGMRVIHE